MRGVAEEADDPLDRLLHAEEVGEGRINLDGPVHEDAAETLIEAGVDHLRLADRLQQALGGARHHGGIVGAFAEIAVHRHLDFALVLVNLGIETEKSVVRRHIAPRIAKEPLLKL